MPIRWSQAALDEQAATEEWIESGAPSLAQLWAERRGQPVAAERMLTVASAAKRLAVSRKTIYRRLPELEALQPPGAEKVGRVWRIRPDALDTLKAARTAERPAVRRP